MTTLELAVAGNDVARARDAARALGGTLYVDERAEKEGLPFRALVTAITDDAGALFDVADVGAFLVCRRVIKARGEAAATPATGASTATASAGGEVLPGVIALFPMVRHPSLDHAGADRYWRDRHAPLALRHHVGMSSYAQLSVVHRIHGPEWDGFALCGFDSMIDLRERFYDSDAGRAAIRDDVARFADGARSPRRLLAIEERYGPASDR